MVKAEKMDLVRGDVLIVGIDVAKKRHYARVYNQMQRDVVRPFHFHNTREGFYRLVSKIEEARNKEGAASVIIGLEPTGHYWKPLAWFLHEQGYRLPPGLEGAGGARRAGAVRAEAHPHLLCARPGRGSSRPCGRRRIRAKT